MAKPIIEARDMVIVYNKGLQNEFLALKNVSAQIYAREYIILFGPSGCGKSTLLYSILGGLPPASGQMLIKGESIYDYKPMEMVEYQRKIIGIIYQAFNLIGSINVLDNVALPQIFMNVPVKEREKRGRELLRKFGINEIIEKKIPANMSGGQQQRVAVARAMVNDPEILLADEPVGNLDSISAEQVMNKLEEINMKDRKTVILVTHDAKYLPYAHRVFYMKDGALRRIVINPEKEQIKRVKPGETIVTEIEQLARMYPYSEPLELKVKSIVNFLTQDMGFTQIQRLEKAVLAVLAGKLSKDMFYEYLLKPVSRGGVGIDAGPASQMSDRMEKIIIQSQNIKKYRNLTHQDRLFLNQYKFIERVFDFIKNECGLSMTSDLSKALSNAISERVGGIITREEFEQRMVLPVNLGGLGFEEKMMILIARHLEKLIAQGAYIIGEAVH